MSASLVRLGNFQTISSNMFSKLFTISPSLSGMPVSCRFGLFKYTSISQRLYSLKKKSCFIYFCLTELFGRTGLWDLRFFPYLDLIYCQCFWLYHEILVNVSMSGSSVWFFLKMTVSSFRSCIIILNPLDFLGWVSTFFESWWASLSSRFWILCLSFQPFQSGYELLLGS